jgi:hypothetical protein
MKTATGTLRVHLMSNHMEELVARCTQQGLKPRSKSAKLALDDYEEGVVGSKRRQPFTRERFVDMIIELIVADDLVHLLFFTLYFTYKYHSEYQHSGIIQISIALFTLTPGPTGFRYTWSYYNT